MPWVLIVCYGNPLRCDDGIAWRAADALDGKFSDASIEILRMHQLAPEVADNLRQRELVIFLDAACIDDIEGGRPGEVRVREVSGAEIREQHPGQFSHVYSPEKVLDLARELYNASPKAFVITVAGENFGHGECLSPTVAGALHKLVLTVEQLVEHSIARSKTTKDTK
jgi:hydrogenase maturation protease